MTFSISPFSIADDGHQELDRYYQLLERSKSLQRTIARLSSEFDDHLVNKPVPPTPGSLSSSSSNHHQHHYHTTTTATAPLYHHHTPPPPLHPPPSFPLPPTPSTSPLPVDGSNSHHYPHIVTTAKRLPSIPTRNSESPPPTPQKYPQQLLTSTTAVQEQEQPITPPDSPHKDIQFIHNGQRQGNHDVNAPLPPPPPPPVIRIKHVQKVT